MPAEAIAIELISLEMLEIGLVKFFWRERNATRVPRVRVAPPIPDIYQAVNPPMAISAPTTAVRTYPRLPIFPLIGITMLPNTSGARNAEEAVRIARLAREVCQTDFVKVEIEHEAKYLLPDNEETIKATEKLAKEGFVVMPYMFPDPIAAKRLEDAGAACVMPLGAMIGSNKGLRARDFIEVIIKNSNVPVIIDAGIGRPSQAAEAMEMGADAVMAYTAIASAGNIPLMARAFKNAIEAGREAYLSGLGKVTEDHAVPSSPTNEADYIG